jgi:PAS domain S-box-containing protein
MKVFLKQTNCKAAVNVPLKAKKQVVGILLLGTPEKVTVPHRAVKFLGELGSQLGLAIKNAQSYDALVRQAGKMANLLTISATLDRDFQLSQLLDLITRQAATLLEADHCYLALPDAALSRLEIKSGFGNPEFKGMPLALRGTASGWVFLHRKPLTVEGHTRKRLAGDKHLHGENAIIVPLLMKDRPIGTLMVVHKRGESARFTADDQDLLSALANQAAMALENAILFEKVSQGKAEWENLFDSITDLITIQDREFRILRVNKALSQRLHTTPKQLIGKPCSEVIHGIETDGAGCPHAGILEQCQSLEQEVSLPHLGGTFTLSTFSLFDARHEPYAFVHVLKDITVQKKLEQQLLQAQKMESMGTLAGGIAHDFNNILAAIIPNAEMIKTKLSSDDPLYKKADTIDKAARRAADLTNQLLSFSRKWRSNVTTINPNQSLTTTIELLGRLINKNIVVETALQPGAWNIEANETQIVQVIMNLALNACDAMPQGGTLTLGTKNQILSGEFCKTKLGLKPGKYVCIYVRDTGMGMTKEVLERAFEPFYTTKETGKGTGLGLSVVYGIVKNHGGYIEAHSELGVGTVFHVYFPSSEKAIAREKPSEEGIPHGHGRILIADDEELVRNMLCGILQELGYDVLVAADGKEALEVYKQKKEEIDLVILDMIMPRMDGGETYKHLKRMNPQVKALLSSGYSQEGKVQEVLNKGISGFIQKPYTMQEIARMVQQALK